MSELIQHGLNCEDCNSSDALAEYENGTYCFSCRALRFKKAPKSRLDTAIEEMADELRQVKALALPKDFTLDLPQHAVKYLKKYHITKKLQTLYNIGWSENCYIYSQRKKKMVNMGGRLIYPGYDKGDLKYFEARSLDHDSFCKYITVGGKKDLFFTGNKGTKLVILVEDILSAIRVGQVNPAIALRGTSMNLDKLLQVAKLGENFGVWLDSDVPGQDAASNIRNKLKWYGKVCNIVTTKDPKCYTTKEIKQHLKDQLKDI